MKYKVYVDGQHGTTGLQIDERLKKHPYVERLLISYEDRRSEDIRKKLMEEADIVFLCLPDTAAKEAVAMLGSSNAKIIDASTAHRVNDDWVYGMPELKGQRKKIEKALKVSNPGCHATGFILSVVPLVQEGLISPDYPVTCYSITGYSGGGKQLIAKYEKNSDMRYAVPRQYALGLKHKHLPEMRKYTGLKTEPLFTPIVSNYYKGMAVSVPIVKKLLPSGVTIKRLYECLSDYYAKEHFVKVAPLNDTSALYDGGFDITGCNNTNNLEIFIYGNEENILITARLDNLGKGASGAAVQNMNIMLGIEETAGLIQ